MTTNEKTIRITTHIEYTKPDNTKIHGVRDHSAVSGTTDDNWRSLMSKYDEVSESVAKNNGRITHIFFKGDHQFDQPSDEVKELVRSKIGNYSHFDRGAE